MATLTLTVPAQLELELKARAAALNRDIETVALELVEKGLRETPKILEARDLTPEQRLENLQAWVKTLPRVDVVLDVSRESMY